MLLLLAACAPHHPAEAVGPPAPAGHAGDATAARDALVTADLPRFHAIVERMGGEFPIAGQLAEPQAGVVAALGRARAAVSLSEAGEAWGAVGVACGECHATVGAEIPAIVPGLAQGDGVRTEMARHDRALALIWSGLVRPSDDDLRAGADGAPRGAGARLREARRDVRAVPHLAASGVDRARVALPRQAPVPGRVRPQHELVPHPL